MIFHLCSYYTTSKLYRNLFYQIDKSLILLIYVFLRSKKLKGLNDISLIKGDILYFKIWEWYHRFLYQRKIRTAFKFSIENIEEKKIRLIHAHTWYSDGGIAYLLNKKFNIPYIIAIRDTDLNLFYKKLPFKKEFGHKVLVNANQIVFISPAYKQELLSLLPETLKKDVLNKSIIIPNGVNDFWFNNATLKLSNRMSKKELKLLFVGEITERKNIERIIKSVILLKSKDINVTLKLVGFKNDSAYEKKIVKKYGYLKYVSFIDKINSKMQLLEYYRESDLFIMPSRTDTFGLVYIEALTQGVPIIYSKGQGVDGYFNDINVGVAVNYKSIKEISDAVITICNNYSLFVWTNNTFLSRFKWENIASTYIDLYSKISS